MSEEPITQETHPGLWEALKKRGLLYHGDGPGRFIEGWEAMDTLRRNKGEEESTFKHFSKVIGDKQLEIDRERALNRRLMALLAAAYNQKAMPDDRLDPRIDEALERRTGPRERRARTDEGRLEDAPERTKRLT